MKQLYILTFFIQISSFAQDISSIKSGDWLSPNTWSTGTVPTASTNAIIAEGQTITLNNKVISKSIFLKGVLSLGVNTSSISFNTTKFLPNANKIIAHQGAWKTKGFPGNSIASLQQAIKLGCYGSEFDVHMSADSGLFICHDDAIQGLTIEKTNSAALAQLKLSNGEYLPTLKAYIEEALKQNHTRLILEIKPSIISSSRGIATAERIVRLVSTMNAQEWVQYISFDYNICRRVKSMEPTTSVSYLGGDQTPDQLAADKLDMDYSYNILQKNENWIDTALQKKVSAGTWTIDSKDLMVWFLLTKNVDFITTNQPEIGLTIGK